MKLDTTSGRGPRGRARIRVAVAPLVLGLLLVGPAGPGLAHSHPPAGTPAGGRAAAEQLTRDLVALNARYHLAAAADRGALHAQLLGVAAARHQFLLALVESDPAGVLRVAVPDHVRASLPPAAQPLVENEEEHEGDLEVLHEDRAVGSRYRYFLDLPGRRLALHFAQDPPELLTGTRIRVRGLRVGEALALQSGGGSVQALASVLSNTFGEQRTIVILVNFQDNTSQPYGAAFAQSVVFGTTSDWDVENSFQQTWLTGDVVDWSTIALSATVCDYSTLASLADQAATAKGFTLANYRRKVYAFPDNACDWWGLGTVGGNPSRSWINGSLQLRVVAHEMGHNFGLYHSHALECGTTVLAPSCSNIEYGDYVDVMGSSSGHFTAFQKERLGWLAYGSSPPITTVEGTGTYPLEPYETIGTGAKALKVLKSTDPGTGKKTWYYVEYRQTIGFDGFLSSNLNVLNGVVIHTGAESSADSSFLLDMTPATSSWSDPALLLGTSYYDPAAGVTISPAAVGPGGASVSVSFDPVPCVRQNPTVALSPAQSGWVLSGTTVVYTVSVTNRDNTSCAGSSFALAAVAPSGVTAVPAVPSLFLDPGASGATTLEVTSTVEGFHTVTVTASNAAEPAYTGSGSATYVVAAALDVGVGTDKASYRLNQTVTVTATVAHEGTPAAGATVTFAIKKPNGSTAATGTATTNALGVATFKHRLKKQDPTGTWSAQATATVSNGAISGNNSATFTATK